MDNHHESKSPMHFHTPKHYLEDRTNSLLSAIGKGLIFSFFMPILVVGPGVSKLVFPNILVLLSNNVGWMLKFQVIYPLIAGIVAVILARGERTQGRATAIIGLSVLPVLVLLLNQEVQAAFNQLGEKLTNDLSIQLQLIISALAIFMMLASAHAVRVEPKHKFVGNMAVIGGYLYFLSLLIPANGKFVFLEPFRYLTGEDPSGAGILFVAGLASLTALVLLSIAAVMCFLIQRTEIQSEKVALGDKVISLWVWHLIAYAGAIYYMLFLSIIIGAPNAGGLLVMFTMALIKFVPWILGLYVLVPLAISEFILTTKILPKPDQINS